MRDSLRIVRGDPSDEELAALTIVLAVAAARAGAARAAATAARRGSRPLWPDRHALIGAGISAGPGAWRTSGLPRQPARR